MMLWHEDYFEQLRSSSYRIAIYPLPICLNAGHKFVECPPPPLRRIEMNQQRQL